MQHGSVNAICEQHFELVARYLSVKSFITCPMMKILRIGSIPDGTAEEDADMLDQAGAAGRLRDANDG